MANVELSIKIDLSDTIDGGWFVVDDQDVTLVRGKGSVTVEANAEHGFQFWFAGAPGGTLAYEIKQEEKSLAKGKSTISAGRRYGRGGGDFKVA